MSEQTEWWYLLTGTDRAPIFTNNSSDTKDLQGPFASLSEAVSNADKVLRHDINCLRRSLSELRRGDYAVINKYDLGDEED